MSAAIASLLISGWLLTWNIEGSISGVAGSSVVLPDESSELMSTASASGSIWNAVCSLFPSMVNRELMSKLESSASASSTNDLPVKTFVALSASWS